MSRPRAPVPPPPVVVGGHVFEKAETGASKRKRGEGAEDQGLVSTFSFMTTDSSCGKKRRLAPFSPRQTRSASGGAACGGGAQPSVGQSSGPQSPKSPPRPKGSTQKLKKASTEKALKECDLQAFSMLRCTST
mmetsp:Transcript_36658/g.90201  ORF Transcript_36658/g.90201 Transcript_36658/m.90201 type:complete len:133 (-) Transcript_36658:266-664(-)